MALGGQRTAGVPTASQDPSGPGAGGAGVTTFNGLAGAVTGVGSFNGAAGNVTFFPSIDAATFVALAAIPSATLGTGQMVFVRSAQAVFFLTVSGAAARTNFRVAASGKAGSQWVRAVMRNPIWEVQTTWVIDPTNSTGLASDDNSGVDATHPLLTWQEHAWRWESAQIVASVAVSVLGAQAATDQPTYTHHCAIGAAVTWTATAPTVVYTGTVGTYTLMNVAAAAADDAQLFDASIAGGSFTAAGALAKGIKLRATTGGLGEAYVLQDLGGTTCRTSRPMTAAGANATFTAGETYQILALPQILFLRFTDVAPFSNVIFGFDYHTSTSNLGYPAIRMAGTYISQCGRGVFSQAINCCMDSGGYLHFLNSADVIRVSAFSGAIKGTGGQTIALGFGTIKSEAATICFQNCRVLIENGTFNTGQLCFYDVTAGPCITTGTGGRVHMLGPVGGKGNTGKLFSAGQSSQIVSTLGIATGGAFVAASTTDPLPVQAGSTTSATAITLDANMNGVFGTA